jgi:ribosomal protein S18 acetylase RimI-like enzyme
MTITYKDIKNFEESQLEKLFLSVNWSSGKYPDKLKIAMENSSSVYSAWDGERLVGLINVLSDGIMTAYIHYLLVDPEYHGKGIGQELINRCLQEYKNFARIVLIAYNERIDFYKKMGFEIGEGKTPMFITYLTT